MGEESVQGTGGRGDVNVWGGPRCVIPTGFFGNYRGPKVGTFFNACHKSSIYKLCFIVDQKSLYPAYSRVLTISPQINLQDMALEAAAA